jgi:hypothetical protein
MKTNTPHLLALGAALLLAPLTSAFATSSWETVDNLTPWRGRDIVSDANGNFISMALDNSTSSTGPVSTAVSLSSNGGLTWQVVGFIPGYAIDLAVAPDGALFASGNRTATVSGRAVVWQSLDHGATWSQSDPWAGQTTQFLCTDVGAGNSGIVYLCGSASGRWLLRKGERTVAGLVWSTIDNIAGSPNSLFVRPGLPSQPDDILVSGSAASPWTVRRSSDSGATWVTVDNYSVSGPTAVTIAPDSSLYAAGHISKTITVTNQVVRGKKVVETTSTATEYGWLIRKSSNGGASWTNVDYVANGWPAYTITADAFGRVFSIGWIQGATGDTWAVRGSSDGGATWINTDLFVPADTTGAHAQGIACDALGNVCVIGETGASASTYAAPIRRLAAP